MSDEELFFAWLDGELGGAEAAAMEAKLRSDPALARRAEQHRSLQARLTGAFEPVAEAPVPPAMMATLAGRPADVTDIASERERRPVRNWIPQWASMAAFLAAGVLVGALVTQQPPDVIDAQGGRIFAAAGLDEALSAQLAGMPTDQGIRAPVTFRASSGAICRTFVDASMSGLACRRDGRWEVTGLFGGSEGQTGEYRMAAGPDPRLASLVESSIEGAPFDAAQEKAAKLRGWR